MLYWYALIRYVSLLSSSYSILELLRTIQMLGHTIVRLMIYMHIWLRAKYTKSKISSPKKILEVFIDYFIWEFTKTRYTRSFDSLKYKFRYCHIGIKTEFASLVMPPTQLRPLLARGQIKQCKMDIWLENIYPKKSRHPMHSRNSLKFDIQDLDSYLDSKYG